MQDTIYLDWAYAISYRITEITKCLITKKNVLGLMLFMGDAHIGLTRQNWLLKIHDLSGLKRLSSSI